MSIHLLAVLPLTLHGVPFGLLSRRVKTNFNISCGKTQIKDKFIKMCVVKDRFLHGQTIIHQSLSIFFGHHCSKYFSECTHPLLLLPGRI